MTNYELNLKPVTIIFDGVETRYLNIELFEGQEWLDCVVIEKEHILWLLGLREDNEG